MFSEISRVYAFIQAGLSLGKLSDHSQYMQLC